MDGERGTTMGTAVKHANDAAQIAEVLEAYGRAIAAKDACAAVSFYARDVVSYDLAPPLQMEGAAVRDPGHLQQWFDTWDGPIESQAHDLRIVADGDVAYAFTLRRMRGTKKDGERIDLWFRATACFWREGDTWKITHVHNSVPFAMDGTQRALLDLEP